MSDDLEALLQGRLTAVVEPSVTVPAGLAEELRRRYRRRQQRVAVGVTLSGLLAVGGSMLASGFVDVGSGPSLQQTAVASMPPGPRLSPSKPPPIAAPPTGPCIFPNSSELGELKGFSSVVIEGSVAAVVADASNKGAYFPHHEVSVLKSLAGTAPSSLRVMESGGPLPLLQPGHFVLFLKETTIPGLYFVLNGRLGAFPISDGSVDRFCPNYNDPPSPRPALGNGVPLDSFEAAIQSSVSAPAPTKSK